MPDGAVQPFGDQLFPAAAAAPRIVFLGQQVDDDLANRICAELVLLAAEDPMRDISLYINSPGGSVSAGLAILRRDAVRAERRRHLRDGHGRVDGPGAALRGYGGQAVRHAALPDPDAPAVRGLGGTANRHSGFRPSRCCTSSGRWRERIAFHTGQTFEQIELDFDQRPLVHRRRGQGLRLRRPGGPDAPPRCPRRARSHERQITERRSEE